MKLTDKKYQRLAKGHQWL